MVNQGELFHFYGGVDDGSNGHKAFKATGSFCWLLRAICKKINNGANTEHFARYFFRRLLAPVLISGYVNSIRYDGLIFERDNHVMPSMCVIAVPEVADVEYRVCDE
jgi:hypothetical protein